MLAPLYTMIRPPSALAAVNDDGDGHHSSAWGCYACHQGVTQTTYNCKNMKNNNSKVGQRSMSGYKQRTVVCILMYMYYTGGV